MTPIPVLPIPVSVVVMTRDNAATLPWCLEALAPFAEVFVVDSDSTDGTADLAAAWGARVVTFRWNGQSPKKKQWCLDTLPFAHRWVLYVDADERLTPELTGEIAALMARGPAHAGYFITGRPVFGGVPLRFGAVNRKLALLDRRRARFPPCPDLDLPGLALPGLQGSGTGEVEGHYQPVLDGTAGRLRHGLWHGDSLPPALWFARHNRYSDWEAALAAAGRTAALRAGETPGRRRLKRLFAALPLRPLAVFLHGYGLRLGFLDGRAGFDYALARAFYYWQIGVKRRYLAAALPVRGAAAPLPPVLVPPPLTPPPGPGRTPAPRRPAP